MAETNSKRTVSMVLYIITVAMLLIMYAATITAAIYSRPTTEEVKVMINEQFQEQSYLGQKLLHIEQLIKTNKENIEHITNSLPKNME